MSITRLAPVAARALVGLAACAPNATPGIAVPSTPYATAVGGPSTDSYCNEAVAQAQDSARIANATGTTLDVSRAQNTDRQARSACN